MIPAGKRRPLTLPAIGPYPLHNGGSRHRAAKTDLDGDIHGDGG